MKNKQFSDKNHLTTRTSLYVGGIAALLLTGCSAVSENWENFTGTRAQQVVSGSRRIPTLNPHRAMPSKIEQPQNTENAARVEAVDTNNIRQPEPVRMQQPASPPSDDNPFDKYDANGNEISSDKTDSTTNKNSNFFTDLTGIDFSSSKPVTPKEPLPASNNEPVFRKPLAGNPYSPEGTAVAPLITAPANNSAKESELYKESEPEKRSSVEPQKENFFDRIGSYFSDEKKLDNATSDFNNMPATSERPEISSVPPKPTEFDVIKNEKQQNFDDLKLERTIATQEKESLEREVSGMTPEKSVNSLTPPSIAPIVVEEKKTDLKQPDLTQKIMSLPEPKSEEPLPETNLGKTTTSITEEKPAFFQNSSTMENKPSSEPTTVVYSTPFPEKPTPEQIPADEQKSSYFDRIMKSLDSDSTVQSDAKPEPKKEETIKETNVIEFAPKPIISETITENNFKNDVVTPVKESDDKISTSADSDNKSDPYSNFQPASKVIGDTSALPSPDIIKTMRPSRYESLRQQSNSNR